MDDQLTIETPENVELTYDLAGLEAAFAPVFTLKEKARIAGSERTLLLFSRR